jgi:hypothetical protein
VIVDVVFFFFLSSIIIISLSCFNFLAFSMARFIISAAEAYAKLFSCSGLVSFFSYCLSLDFFTSESISLWLFKASCTSTSFDYSWSTAVCSS